PTPRSAGGRVRARRRRRREPRRWGDPWPQGKPPGGYAGGVRVNAAPPPASRASRGPDGASWRGCRTRVGRVPRMPGDGAPRGAPTLHDVARLAGVSIKTVSEVVNRTGRVAAATTTRVESAITRLGYQPNLSARRLRMGSTGVIGLAVPELST